MYVTLCGELWRFTRKAWIAYCNASAVAGSSQDPNEFGAKSLSLSVREILDWEEVDYTQELRRLGRIA